MIRLIIKRLKAYLNRREKKFSPEAKWQFAEGFIPPGETASLVSERVFLVKYVREEVERWVIYENKTGK